MVTLSEGCLHIQCGMKEEDELPPWARKEKERELASMEKKDLPFGVFLLGSAVVAIAAVRLSSLG